jgi:hypothetical protein
MVYLPVWNHFDDCFSPAPKKVRTVYRCYHPSRLQTGAVKQQFLLIVQKWSVDRIIRRKAANCEPADLP